MLIRADLGPPLVGRYVVADGSRLTRKMRRTLTTPLTHLDEVPGRLDAIRDALARLIVASNLPGGHSRAGLERLSLDELGAVCRGPGWTAPDG